MYATNCNLIRVDVDVSLGCFCMIIVMFIVCYV